MRLPVHSRHLTRQTCASGTWKPCIAPFMVFRLVSLWDGESRLQSLPMAVRAQERGESERCPVMGRIGVETSPRAKACRLPHGLCKRVDRALFTGGKQRYAATRACALPGVTWDGINWANVQRHVRGLQMRIVKATQDGRHNKVKALQWLLTHSFV